MKRQKTAAPTIKNLSILVIVFTLGTLFGSTFSGNAAADDQPDIDGYVFGRAEAVLVALHNIVISLSVDTERSAVNIAEMDKRVAKIELRLAALEKNGSQ